METAADKLRALEEEPERYEALVRDHGLAVAAHTIAVWRIEAMELGKPVPTRSDVLAAARTLRVRCGLRTIPSGRVLAGECRAAGLRVI